MSMEQSIRKKVWIPAVLVVVLAAGGGTFWLMQNRANAATTSQATIRWTTVQRGNVEQTVDLSGTLEPRNEVAVTGSGKVLSVAVQAGDHVQKGQVIAQLDDSAYQIQLTAAKAQLTAAEAKLNQAEQPVTQTTGNGRGTVTLPPDPNTIAQDQAAVAQAQAQVDQLEQEIADCTVRSPITGTVLQVVNPNQSGLTLSSTGSSAGYNGGNSSQSGNSNTLAVIADLSAGDFEVQATVDQADATSIHPGQQATIKLTANGGVSLTGKVTSIGYLPQTQSGVTVYPVVIQVNPPAAGQATLLPGESGTVSVVVQQANNVLTLPTAAITQWHGQTGVYVRAGTGTTSSHPAQANNTPGSDVNAAVSSAGLQFQPVTVGLYGGNTVEIQSGLSEGEQVAIVLPANNANSTTAGASRSSLTGLGGLSGLGSCGLNGQGWSGR
ncbi:MAG: HlyD family efflux transporter periplasmic adaptor subunit, partial [Alicyclobacillus sp.]|nr:HlyD family efflux transporter periplasmic adaptor subunit [Alicyclobacillus sp.]